MFSEALTEPRGHGATLAGLFDAAREGRLPHALCFRGEDGVGKFPAALHFAAGVLCSGGPATPCGSCTSCKLVAAGSHPDLYVLDVVSEGAERLRIHRFVVRPSERIPKEDRDKEPVERFLALRPAMGGARVVVVRAMERAVHQAQNAILKMLEEPTPGVFWVLETSRPKELLPTIRSRTVPVPFAPLSDTDVAEILREELAERGLEWSAEDLAELARWGRGSVGRALSLGLRAAPAMRDLVWQTLCGGSALEAARAIDALEGAFSGNTPRAKARDRARLALDVAIEVCGDVLRRDAGRPAVKLVHGSLDPAELSSGATARRALCSLGGPVLEVLCEARTDVDANLSPEACVDRGFLALARLAAANPDTRSGAPERLSLTGDR